MQSHQLPESPELVQLYGMIKDLAVKKNFNEYNYVELIIIAMTTVERFCKGEGAQKKQMVIQVLTKLVDELPITENVKNLIKWSMPTIIDGLVAATNGEVAVNVRKGCGKIFSCCK
jgi:hypothetical protein